MALLVIFVVFSIVKGIYKLAIRLVLILVLVIAGYIGWTWWQGKIDTPVGAAESVRDMGRQLSEKIKEFASEKLDRDDLKTLWDNLKDSTLEKIKSKKLAPEEKEALIQTLMEKKSELDPSKHPEIMEELNSLLSSLKDE
jgi:predicted negative regulator of RcsB-dependent stress response